MMWIDWAKARLKALLCQHHSRVYEPPRVVREGEARYIVSRSYCADCGAGVPFPPRHDSDAAARMLYEHQGPPR